MKINDIVDMNTFKLRMENLTEEQKDNLHLLDKRVFPESYKRPEGEMVYNMTTNVSEGMWLMHKIMDNQVLEIGAQKRFDKDANRNYLKEKMQEDYWVSVGNSILGSFVENHINQNLEQYKDQEKIKLIDIGPATGAITTYFALKGLAKHDLLDKVEVTLVDIVDDVLEQTTDLDFVMPNQEIIKVFGLDYGGLNGEKYLQLVKGFNTYCADAGNLNKSNDNVISNKVKDADIILAGYVHHHMNLHGMKDFCNDMQNYVRNGGFVGIVDFAVKDFNEYMGWMVPFVKKTGHFPPVESPCTDANFTKSLFNEIDFNQESNSKLSYVIGGEKK